MFKKHILQKRVWVDKIYILKTVAQADKAHISLDRQNIFQDKLLQENCPSPSYTERNVPKELTSTLCIAGFENVWNKPKIK